MLVLFIHVKEISLKYFVMCILVTHLGLEAVICHFSLSQHSSKSHCKTASWKATPLLLFFCSYFTFFCFVFFHPFISFSISVCYTPLYHLHPPPSPSFLCSLQPVETIRPCKQGPFAPVVWSV